MTPTMLDSDLRSGDHLCAIYDTDADWLVTAVAYFGEGLARHEACVSRLAFGHELCGEVAQAYVLAQGAGHVGGNGFLEGVEGVGHGDPF